MSRLGFGPEPKQMEVTDIRTGHFVFTPVEGEEISFEALDETIGNAGYEIENATIEINGVLTYESGLQTPDGQVFALTAADSTEDKLDALEPGDEVTVRGAWSTEEAGETVAVEEIDSAAADGDDGDGGPV